VSLARLLRGPALPGRDDIQAGTLAHRPEPLGPNRTQHDERRRIRSRLVRLPGRARCLQGHSARLERHEPEEPRGADPVPHVHGARAGGHRRDLGPADQLSPVSLRPLAVSAQRTGGRIRSGATRAGFRSPAGSLQPHAGQHRLGGDVPPGADLRTGRRPDRGARADGRLRGGEGVGGGHSASHADDRRTHGRAPRMPSAIRRTTTRGPCTTAAVCGRSGS